jgi:hypothetical protein
MILAAAVLGGVAGITTPAAAAAVYSPVGSLDPLAFFPDDSVVVYGWAADPEGITTPLEVHVYVDGARGYRLRTGTHVRPDVLAVTGAPNAGMVGVLPPQGPGLHQVCAYAINIGLTGTNTLIGCRSYGFPVAAHAPTGSVEPLAFFPDDSPVVYGWAADHNAINQVLDVHIWVDGARGYVARTGTHQRPDVTAAVGAPNAGFVAVLPPQGPGRHTICAYAINIGPPGPNTVLGCRAYGSDPAPPPAPQRYPNCEALNRDYPYGVGRIDAVDKTDGVPVTNFAVNAAVYDLNYRNLDRDLDGIACESH